MLERLHVVLRSSASVKKSILFSIGCQTAADVFLLASAEINNKYLLKNNKILLTNGGKGCNISPNNAVTKAAPQTDSGEEVL